MQPKSVSNLNMIKYEKLRLKDDNQQSFYSHERPFSEINWFSKFSTELMAVVVMRNDKLEYSVDPFPMVFGYRR